MSKSKVPWVSEWQGHLLSCLWSAKTMYKQNLTCSIFSCSIHNFKCVTERWSWTVLLVLHQPRPAKYDNDNDDNGDNDDNDNADDNDVQPVPELCFLQWEQPYREVHKCATAHIPPSPTPPCLTITITIVEENKTYFHLDIEKKVDFGRQSELAWSHSIKAQTSGAWPG